MVRSATQFPMVLPWFNHDFFFFFFFLQVRFLTSLFFFFFFCEISHPKISPWETLFSQRFIFYHFNNPSPPLPPPPPSPKGSLFVHVTHHIFTAAKEAARTAHDRCSTSVPCRPNTPALVWFCQGICVFVFLFYCFFPACKNTPVISR